MYKISKQFTFSASHQLLDLDKGHPCMRVHGHNYTVILHLKARNLNVNGFVKDYHSLDVVKKWIDDMLDHKHLNDVLPNVWQECYQLSPFAVQPSAENIARLIFDRWKEEIPELYAVAVKETDKTEAIYEES